MTARHEYRLFLPDVQLFDLPASPGLLLRHPTATDSEGLAVLMLDAYQGTIDSSGETLDDARNEVRSFFEQVVTPPLLDCSWVAQAGAGLAAAALAVFWTRHGCPLIAYVITRAAHKQHGLARLLVAHSLACLCAVGYAEVRAVITEGNLPSERLFARLGFAPL